MLRIDWTLLVQVGNFFLLFFVLNKVLFRPLFAVVSRRNQELADSAECLATFKREAREKQEEYEVRLAEARQSAAREQVSLRAKVETEKEQVLGEVRQQASAQLEKAREEIAGQRQQAVTELGQQVPSMAREIAAKVLGRAL